MYEESHKRLVVEVGESRFYRTRSGWFVAALGLKERLQSGEIIKSIFQFFNSGFFNDVLTKSAMLPSV